MIVFLVFEAIQLHVMVVALHKNSMETDDLVSEVSFIPRVWKYQGFDFGYFNVLRLLFNCSPRRVKIVLEHETETMKRQYIKYHEEACYFSLNAFFIILKIKS